MEGQVGQQGIAFEEAKGGGWDFPGEDPLWGPSGLHSGSAVWPDGL